MVKKILASLVAATFLAIPMITLTACNTVEGAGKDVEAGGRAIKDEARKDKPRSDN